jgi:hypothetical protein
MGDGVLEAIFGLYGITGVHSKEVHTMVQWRGTDIHSKESRAAWYSNDSSDFKVVVTPHVSKPHDYVNHMFMRL